MVARRNFLAAKSRFRGRAEKAKKKKGNTETFLRKAGLSLLGCKVEVHQFLQAKHFPWVPNGFIPMLSLHVFLATSSLGIITDLYEQ